MTRGERFADKITAIVGSWWFIILQSLFILAWMALNQMGLVDFDKYPFTALNLLLSFEAAYTAPFILMSQNREAMVDRMHQHDDLAVDEQSLAHLQDMTDTLAALHATVALLHEKISSLSPDK